MGMFIKFKKKNRKFLMGLKLYIGTSTKARYGFTVRFHVGNYRHLLKASLCGYIYNK